MNTGISAYHLGYSVIDQSDFIVATSQQTYSVVSMFSGCGGMDLGFRGGFTFLGTHYERLPFQIIWANEINQAACRTYRKNIDERIICGDIWNVLESIPQDIDVLIGGFPCQDISINGKGAGVDGKRSGLYRAMVEAIKIAKPKIFVAENVKGLLMRHNRASLEKILEDFGALGYKVSYKLYHAANYGVPQSRERVFIVGISDHSKEFIPPKEHISNENWITAQDAIGDLELLESNPAINHIWSLANRSPDQGNRQLEACKPGHTIRAECHGNIQYHYKLPRRISMREARMTTLTIATWNLNRPAGLSTLRTTEICKQIAAINADITLRRTLLLNTP